MTLQDQLMQWVEVQAREEYEVLAEDETHFRLHTPYGIGEINFYPEEIAEYRIFSKAKNDDVFFLHFRLTDLNRAKELFLEMRSVLLDLENQHEKKILLCCSCGITTSYFAQKLQDCADALELDYSFHAVDISKVFREAASYDMVLIAPQIAYQYKKIRNFFPDLPVIKMSGTIFGSYDASGMINEIQKTFYALEEKNQDKKDDFIQVVSTGKVLVIGNMKMTDSAMVKYCVMDHGEVLFEGKTIKTEFTNEDLKDIVDIELLYNPDLQAIGISLPGIVENGIIDLPEDGFHDFDLEGWLSEFYHLPVCVENDVNAAAIGYHFMHPEYEHLTFHFQPTGSPLAGQGNVVNGRIAGGMHGISGEVKFFLNDLKTSKDLDELIWTEEGQAELISKFLLMNILQTAPEHIVLCTEMKVDVDAIHAELAKRLPEKYIPEIRLVKDLHKYMFLGQTFLTIQKLQND